MKSKLQITALFFLVLSFLFLSNSISAATFKVSTTSEFRQALLDAAGNGEDDTIILNAGTYKTTDDGLGTFTFSDSEAHNLTIKAKDGLTRNDVILDGDNTDQVLDYENTETDSVLTVDTITVQNCYTHGSGNTGGGISSSSDIIITNTTISNNVAYNGGGIHAGKEATVINSTISNNSANKYGGGIYGESGATITITNSIISNNSVTNIIPYNFVCSDYNKKFNTNGNETIKKVVIIDNIDPLLFSGTGYGAGIYASAVTVTNSTISNNRALIVGGGIYANAVTIRNSTISGNDGGGIYANTVNVTNSTISENISGFCYSTCERGGGIYAGDSVTAINSTISDNSSTAGGGICGKGNFINNIFTNNSSDIYFSGDSNLYNNFIDNTKLENELSFVITKENNVEPEEVKRNYFPDSDLRLGAHVYKTSYDSESLNFADSDFRLGAGSIAINKGLNPSSKLFKKLINDKSILKALKTDKDGNKRIRGKAIDLGAYEYLAFTITASAGVGGSITPKGNMKVTYGTDRTFTITPKKGYKIAKVKVDGVSVGAVKTYTFTNITKNHSISATFKKK
ncbi:MAG: right-handed parallel beta-helix repeat-containing protein [Candidatus Schekmanbacteria bacterium]|nr:right-handed parallel beta-helix repeat-containing protein [Candidatus Schekmanbacteria bacterium]